MALTRPTRPPKISGTNTTMTITTVEWTTDAMGQAFPEPVSTRSGISVRLDTLSPSEAFRYGHAVNDTIYRLLAPVKDSSGVSITLTHTQYVSIGSIEYEVLGEGKPEGSSGWQTATLRRRGK